MNVGITSFSFSNSLLPNQFCGVFLGSQTPSGVWAGHGHGCQPDVVLLAKPALSAFVQRAQFTVGAQNTFYFREKKEVYIMYFLI